MNGVSRKKLSSVVILSALASVLPLSATDASFPGSNGRIAFEFDNKILTVDPPDGSPEEVPGPTLVGADPAWSPDGSRIAFVGQGAGNEDIFVMHANGSHRRRLTTGSVNEDPSWSPDGAKIVYVRRGFSDSFPNPGSDREIVTMNADGSDMERLTDNTWTDDEPAWSPDGTQIVFIGRGIPDSPPNTGSDAVQVMDDDGDNVTIFQYHGGPDEYPAWSPDGEAIAWEFSSNIAVKDAGTGDVDPDTIESLTGTHDDAIDGFQPAWSPDGSKIAFVGRRPDQQADYEMYLIDSDDGGNQTQVTEEMDLPVASGAPDWQPIPICTQTGGPGGQVLVGTSDPDVLCGGAGDDVLKGKGDNDILIGGGGDDDLVGGGGNDITRGDKGKDTADYRTSAKAVDASLKKEFATGHGRDVLVLVEIIKGSDFGDDLQGAAGANVLKGGLGNDQLDVRDGVRGNDSVDGGPGAHDVCRKDRRDTATGCP